MRILLITSRYLPHRGGLETVVSFLAREFQRQGHVIQIITNRYPRTLPGREMMDGVQVTRLHFLKPGWDFIRRSRFDLYLASLFYCPLVEHQLKSLIDDFKPDVINSHYLNEPAEFVERFLSRTGSSIPWIVSLHGGDVDGEPLKDKPHLDRFRKVVCRAEKLTACSRFLAAQAVSLEASISNKIQVIHNGVDVDLFSKAQNPDSPVPYILAVGQLFLHKGFDLLIDAFAIASKKHREVNLVIAGEGEFRSNLEQQIKVHGLENRVSLVGKVGSEEVARLMKGSLFVAMPSRREPFGIVALEGMAAGKCVLASPVGGIPEFLPCPPNQMIPPDVSVWAQALDEWLGKAANGHLNGSENRVVARQHAWGLVSDQYLMVYEQAIA